MRTLLALLCLAGSILILGLRESPPARPVRLPHTANPLIIRTSFESRAKWERIRRIVETPIRKGETELRAHVEFINEVRFRDLTTKELLALVPRGYGHSFLMVLDGEAMSDPEMPLLVLDLRDRRGHSFRVLPAAVQTVENNLSIANVDFEEFLRLADPDGVYRGLPRPGGY